MTFALRTLEFEKIRARLAELASFSAGRELALRLEPTADPEEARRWQAGTAEALRLGEQKPDLALGGAHDIRPEVERAALGGMLLPDELLRIADVVRCARRWRANLTRLAHLFPTLAAIAHRLGEHRPLLEEITAAIADSGELRDDASPELRRLREALRTALERVRARLQDIITSPTTRPALQEPIITERGGRYVVPVKAEARGRIKGVVHDQSASGATLFIEPLEVVELTNRWRQLQVEEQEEIERILRKLSRQVAAEAEELTRSVGALAELDLQLAKARLATQQRASRPELRDFDHRAPNEPVVRLVQARHPLLGPDAVPLTLELGRDFDILVITGPNTGGKTVALKTVGLLTLMAQAGLYLPASDGCIVTVFRSVHADIGDEQSIEQSLSTFSSHVSHIVAMLREADDRSLVLLDELGAGTDPQEGAALARALLEHLRQRRVYCIATTHYSELKLYAHAAPRVENASVEFDPLTLRPTYRLIVGQPGRSNALQIAERLGIPRAILERARASLDPARVEAGQLLEQLQRERQSAEEARRLAERERREAARARARLEQEIAEERRRQQRRWRETEEESRRLLEELRREIDALRRAAQRGQVDRETLEQLTARAEQLAPIAPPAEVSVPSPPVERAGQAGAEQQPLAVGMEVMVSGLGVPGTITRLDAETAEVDVRGMRIRLRTEGLTPAPRAERQVHSAREREPATRVVLKARDQQVPLQLDLRGQRRDEAAQELDRYLNEAYLAGLRTVRIVHGKGTGAVRQAVHELLEHHPLVRRYALAQREAGGEGATEVELVA